MFRIAFDKLLIGLLSIGDPLKSAATEPKDPFLQLERQAVGHCFHSAIASLWKVVTSALPLRVRYRLNVFRAPLGTDRACVNHLKGMKSNHDTAGF